MGPDTWAILRSAYQGPDLCSSAACWQRCSFVPQVDRPHRGKRVQRREFRRCREGRCLLRKGRLRPSRINRNQLGFQRLEKQAVSRWSLSRHFFPHPDSSLIVCNCVDWCAVMQITLRAAPKRQKFFNPSTLQAQKALDTARHRLLFALRRDRPAG